MSFFSTPKLYVDPQPEGYFDRLVRFGQLTHYRSKRRQKTMKTVALAGLGFCIGLMVGSVLVLAWGAF